MTCRTSVSITLVITITFLLILTNSALAEGEWTTSDTNIYNTNSGNVGIGTTSPGKLLHISASSNNAGLKIERTGTCAGGFNTFISHFGTSNYGSWYHDAINSTSDYVIRDSSANTNFYVDTSSSNVGIGTSSPQSFLQIGEDSASKVADLRFKTANSNVRIGCSCGGSDFWIKDETSGQFRFYINASGNVGIATTVPQSKFSVNGTITAKEVKVLDTGWSDFVFEDSYTLPSLDNVESYIKENKHLPDIPSAQEVKEKGLAMSEMLAKQMQKIEELTLYLIEMKKKNERLVAELKAENGKLRERISALENIKR